MRQQLVEFDTYIAPDNETYKFRDGIEKFVISGTNGLGLPRINYITQRGPFQHGETILDFRLEPRVLTLLHRRNGCSRQEYWDHRSALLNVLRPNRQPTLSFQTGTLRKILPDGSRRDLSVLVSDGVKFDDNASRWDEFSIMDGIQFIAFDPTIFSPTLISISFGVATAEELVFPFAFQPSDLTRPMLIFSGDALQGSQSVEYTGTWLTYPTITITGPITNPIIRNTTTDEKIEITYTVSAGEVVTITLTYGNKTIVNNSGTNLVGLVTTDSDLATFHIAPDPEATDGINIITAEGTNAIAGTTLIAISYFTRYIGI